MRTTHEFDGCLLARLSQPQRIESAPLWDYSSKNIGEGHSESSTVADTGIPEHVGGDVRQYPVTEEEEEKEEEGEPKDGHVDFMNNPDKIGTSDVQREKEDEQQIGTEDEDEDSRRARVAKEWETIDQVGGVYPVYQRFLPHPICCNTTMYYLRNDTFSSPSCQHVLTKF